MCGYEFFDGVIFGCLCVIGVEFFFVGMFKELIDVKEGV